MKAGVVRQWSKKTLQRHSVTSLTQRLLSVSVSLRMDQGEEVDRKVSVQSNVSKSSLAEAKKVSVISAMENRKISSVKERKSLSSLQEGELQQAARALVPRLSNTMHKGQCGRIAVFGGCVMYTGAPYFAAISALKVGADLVHVFCERDAGSVIKAYSPELIVHPILDQEYGIEDIEVWLPRLHCVVLGPGLGRNQSTLGRMSLVVDKAKNLGIPVVMDADALWQVNANPGLVHGYKHAVLTPNAMEFSRLAKAVLERDVSPSSTPDHGLVAEVAAALGHVTILHKGLRDVISDGRETVECAAAGSPRRCGGQGDLLAGSLATFLHWGLTLSSPPSSTILAAWAAARLARGCGEAAFQRSGRAVTTSDMVETIHPVFSRLYEGETSL